MWVVSWCQKSWLPIKTVWCVSATNGLNHFAKCMSCKMTVVNLESLSPEQEVRQDLLAIIAFHPEYMACVVIKKKLRKLFRNPG